jgi:hypothetical protein
MSYTNFPRGITSFGVPIFGDEGVPHMRDTYLVKKTADSDYAEFCKRYDGMTLGNQYTVCTTADEAFARAGKHDRIIFMAPDSGGHDLTKTITIGSSQFGLKIFGEGPSSKTQRTLIKNPTAAADVDMFVVETDKVEFAGLTFQNRKAGTCIMIGDTAGTAFYQTYIHDCNFTDYGGVATYGISPGAVASAANLQCDAVNLVVERCEFDGFVTAAIVVNGTRSSYTDNYIRVGGGGAASGIKLYSSTDGRAGGCILRNWIVAPATATTIPILISNVGHALFAFNISDNKLAGGTTEAVPITKTTYALGGGNLYLAAATGYWTTFDWVT